MSDKLNTSNDEYSLENLSDIVNLTLSDMSVFDSLEIEKNAENKSSEGDFAMSDFVAPTKTVVKENTVSKINKSATNNSNEKLTWTQKRNKEKLEKEILLAKAKEEAAIETKLAERLAELEQREATLNLDEKKFIEKQKQMLAMVAKKQDEIIAYGEKKRAKQQQIFDENLEMQENAFQEKLRILEEEHNAKIEETLREAEQLSSDAVAQLNKAEIKAEQIIEEARKEAEKIRLDTQEKYKNVDEEIAALKEQSQSEAEQILKSANEEAESIKDIAMARAEQFIIETEEKYQNADAEIAERFQTAQDDIDKMQSESDRLHQIAENEISVKKSNAIEYCMQMQTEADELKQNAQKEAQQIMEEAEKKSDEMTKTAADKLKNAEAESLAVQTDIAAKMQACENVISEMEHKAKTEAEDLLRNANKEALEIVNSAKEEAARLKQKAVEDADAIKKTAEDEANELRESVKTDTDKLRSDTYAEIASLRAENNKEIANLLEKTKHQIEEDLKKSNSEIEKARKECEDDILERETKSREMIENNERISAEKISENEKKSEERIKFNEDSCEAILAERKKSISEKEIEFYKKLNDDKIRFEDEKAAKLEQISSERKSFEAYCKDEQRKIDEYREQTLKDLEERIAEWEKYENKIRNDFEIQQKAIESAQIYNNQYHDELQHRMADFEAEMEERLKQLEAQQNKISADSVKRYAEIFRREQDIYERSMKLTSLAKQLGIEEKNEIKKPEQPANIAEILAADTNEDEHIEDAFTANEVKEDYLTEDLSNRDFRNSGIGESHFDESLLNPAYNVRERKHTYETGDVFTYLGKNYLLKVENVNELDFARIELSDDDILLKAGKRASVLTRRKLFNKWYIERLESYLMQTVDDIKDRLGYPGVIDVSIVNDIKEWFSSNHDQKCIWVNVNLIKIEPIFLEYALISELTKFRIHDSMIPNKLIKTTYEKEMNKYLSGWQQLKMFLSSPMEL